MRINFLFTQYICVGRRIFTQKAYPYQKIWPRTETKVHFLEANKLLAGKSIAEHKEPRDQNVAKKIMDTETTIAGQMAVHRRQNMNLKKQIVRTSKKSGYNHQEKSL